MCKFLNTSLSFPFRLPVDSKIRASYESVRRINDELTDKMDALVAQRGTQTAQIAALRSRLQKAEHRLNIKASKAKVW